jgi:hypothetical protein
MPSDLMNLNHVAEWIAGGNPDVDGRNELKAALARQMGGLVAIADTIVVRTVTVDPWAVRYRVNGTDIDPDADVSVVKTYNVPLTLPAFWHEMEIDWAASAGAVIEHNSFIEVQGIHIYRSDVARVWPAPETGARPTPGPGKLEEWYRTHIANNPQSTRDEDERAAREHFGFRINRDALRALRKDGRPEDHPSRKLGRRRNTRQVFQKKQ